MSEARPHRTFTSRAHRTCAARVRTAPEPALYGRGQGTPEELLLNATTTTSGDPLLLQRRPGTDHPKPGAWESRICFSEPVCGRDRSGGDLRAGASTSAAEPGVTGGDLVAPAGRHAPPSILGCLHHFSRVPRVHQGGPIADAAEAYLGVTILPQSGDLSADLTRTWKRERGAFRRLATLLPGLSWWAILDSNQRPLPCEGSALTI